MTCFMGGSMAGVAGDDGGRNGVIIVLLMNFTVGYALKYAASPPDFGRKSSFIQSNVFPRQGC